MYPQDTLNLKTVLSKNADDLLKFKKYRNAVYNEIKRPGDNTTKMLFFTMIAIHTRRGKS